MLRAVDDVLEEIGAGDRPRLLVLNKADLLDDERRARAGLPPPRRRARLGADGRGPGRAARARSRRRSRRTLRAVELLVPYAEGGRLSELHDVAGDLEREDTAEGVRVQALAARPRVAARFERFAVNGARRERSASARLDPAAAPARPRPRRRRRAATSARCEAVELAPGRARAGRAPGSPWRSRAATPASVLPRSGLAARHGIALVNAPGPDRRRLPRRAARAAAQHRPRRQPFDVGGRRPDRPARRRGASVGPRWSRSRSSSDSARGDGGFGSSGA